MTDIADGMQRPEVQEQLEPQVDSAMSVTRSSDHLTIETSFDITAVNRGEPVSLDELMKQATLLHHRAIGSHKLEVPQAHFAAFVTGDDVHATFLRAGDDGSLVALNRIGALNEIDIVPSGVRALKQRGNAPAPPEGARLIVGGISVIERERVARNMGDVWVLGTKGSEAAVRNLSLLREMDLACRQELDKTTKTRRKGIARRAFKLIGRTSKKLTPDVD